MPDVPPPSEDRLTRLEEHHAFADRTIEQLGDEVRHLSQRLHLALDRMDRLETKLAALLARIDSDPALPGEATRDDSPLRDLPHADPDTPR